ncbi:MAG: rod shape-determining protein MreD [Bacillota bacterium]
MKYARFWLWPLALLVTAALQSTAVHYLSIGWVKPDVILVIVVLVGLLYGPVQGATAGLFAGLLEDLFTGRLIGLFGLTRMLAGYLAGLVERRVYKEPFMVPMATSFVATVVSETLVYVILRFFSLAPGYGGSLIHVIGPAAIYNAVAAPILYRPLRRLKKETDKGTAARV